MTVKESIILKEIPTKYTINTYLLIKDQRCIYSIPDDGVLPKKFGALSKKCFFLNKGFVGISCNRGRDLFGWGRGGG